MIYTGDCVEVMATLPENSVDAIVDCWLQSEDAERRLAAALHESGVNCLRPVAASRNVCLPDRNAGAFHQEDARAILAALRQVEP